jgi:hypothetical protein
MRNLLNPEPRSNKQVQRGAGRDGEMEVGKNSRWDNGLVKSYRDVVLVGQREAAKSEKIQK